MESAEECEVRPYRIDGEVGRVSFDAYFVQDGDQLTGLYAPLEGKSLYRTVGFKELAFVYGVTENSYRKTSQLLQRVRRQAGGTPVRTLQENTEAEGQAVQSQLSTQVSEILGQHQFTEEGVPIKAEAQKRYQQQEFSKLPAEKVMNAIQDGELGPDWVSEMLRNPVSYEVAEETVHVAVDDVGVKRQATTRPISEEEAALKRKHAYQSVAQITHKEHRYVLNGANLPILLRSLIAFLLHNQLLTKNITFFVDGQRTLYTSIAKAFSWFAPVQIILDWHHLEKRSKEVLSMALKGRKARNAVLDELLPYLWHGCVDTAIDMLNKIDPAIVRNDEKRKELIGYLERNRSYIPCYSVRKRLGLYNSSNRGEKANDLIVSQRQKHNGMSWSREGSLALATLTALVRNQEYKQWFQTESLRFAFASPA